MASESRDEARLAGHVAAVLQAGGVPVDDAGDTCVLAGVTERGDRPLLLLAGHLDTVPAQGNRPGARRDGAVWGLGACDMKGSPAVMIELALAAPRPAAFDLGLVFFGREELPAADSALTPLLERRPGLRGADLVLMMEPTANAIQAGCLGNVNATWTFRGRAGHSARPWQADNAIHRAAAGIAALAAVEPEAHDFDGLRFSEVVSVTGVRGGIARNVIPAEARLRGWCEPYGEVTIDSNSPSAPVATGNALVRALLAAGARGIAAKQAWTPIAEFAAAGIDAVNFGPGDPAQAHQRDEHVAEAALADSHAILERLCA
jgi:succinyl-diaminopimelate desuccinylase